MQCPNCSKTIDNDSKFCPFCGAKIDAKQSTESITIHIGRAVDNDYLIQDNRISGHHCVLIVTPDGSYLLKDLNSTNGVFINNQRISEKIVTANDTITLASGLVLDLHQVLQTYKNSEGSEIPSPPSIPINSNILGKNIISIGREHDNDITIKNIRVSRYHAKLTKIGTAWQIEDLNSANGTYINGQKTGKALISEHDKIMIGGVPLDLVKIFSKEMPDWSAGLRLVAQNLSFKVPNKTLVDNLSICFEPGQFIGLIGPSGCGKTTLMMMLNGYLKPSEGSVQINGVSLYHNPGAFQGQIGYVPQDDIIHREITVEESLNFTSKLRLGDQITEEERTRQITQILLSLNLTNAKDTLIGSPEKKGISGGQRKRVNMAQELITEPSLYFLDEPTSGLDPLSDREVMHLLKDIADHGHIVVLTTHKIDALNFSIFSHLIVLTYGGRLAYFGPTQEAIGYFGVSKPEDIFDTLEKTDPQRLQQDYLKSSYCNDWIDSGFKHPVESSHKLPQSLQADALYQFSVLCKRMFLVKFRDTFSAAVLLLQAPIIGLFIFLVFRSTDRIESLYFVLIVAAIWLGCSNSAREIVTEQTIFKREQKANLNIDAYLWSKVCVLSLLCAFQCLILSFAAYITADMSVNFFILNLTLTMTSISALSMGLALSAVVKTGETAMALVPITLIPQVILGGLIVPFGNIPEGVNILAGFMLSRWAFEQLVILEDNSVITDAIGFNADNLFIDIGMIIFMTIVFVFITRFVLIKKTR